VSRASPRAPSKGEVQEVENPIPCGKKGFIIPTKSFVKLGITKKFCYNKMFGSINKMIGTFNKTFGCCGKFLVAATKKIFVVPNFVAVTKQFFSVPI